MVERCAHECCNKKLTVLKFTCKCEQTFCIKHKNSEDHMCTYDFKNNNNLDELIEEHKCISTKIKSI